MLATKPGLSGEQRAAVHRLLTGERLVDCLIAAAGSGKTYSLNLAREMWEGSHYRVIGASLAARAAKELEDQAHIPSRTIAKLLIDLDRGTEKLDDRTVLVIDEAAMVGTALARLFDAAEAGGSRLILVGDPHQLQSIEAGGVLRGLENRLPTIGLTENRRQRPRGNVSRSPTCAPARWVASSPRAKRTVASTSATRPTAPSNS